MFHVRYWAGFSAVDAALASGNNVKIDLFNAAPRGPGGWRTPLLNPPVETGPPLGSGETIAIQYVFPPFLCLRDCYIAVVSD